MQDAKIVVAVKYCGGDLNPFDAAALECALCTGSRDITVLTMSPPSVMPKMEALTRLGVKAVLLTDAAYAGADTLATARTLAAFIKRQPPDFIFCGRQSTDGDTAQVPPCLSALIGYDIVPSVMRLDGDTAYLRSGENRALTGRQVVTFERIKSLRFPSIKAKPAEVTTIDNNELRLPLDLCGQRGSPTRVLKVYENRTGKRLCKFIGFDSLEATIKAALSKQRARVAEYDGPKLKEVYYTSGAEEQARRIAYKCVKLDVEGRDAAAVAAEIRQKSAGIILWSDAPQMRVLAPQVAGLLGAGLCADCTELKTDGENLFMIRPAAGGSVTAEIQCRAPVTMATVRTAGSDGEIIFSVGRGAERAVGKIREMADRLGAEVCCSRAVVDDDAMPYECQVGLTGRTVAPKVYVAFGISGAVQHMCAVERAGTVIAVNKDKNAKIFDYADYGIVAEV